MSRPPGVAPALRVRSVNATFPAESVASTLRFADVHAGQGRAPSPLSPNSTAPRKRTRARRDPDLFAAAAEGVRDLFSASVDDVERDAGRLYRRIVATGGTCPCGARVASWPWADRVAGAPAPIPRVIPHADNCPAWLDLEPTDERNLP